MVVATADNKADLGTKTLSAARIAELAKKCGIVDLETDMHAVSTVAAVSSDGSHVEVPQAVLDVVAVVTRLAILSGATR